jgi:hypothetical protein
VKWGELVGRKWPGIPLVVLALLLQGLALPLSQGKGKGEAGLAAKGPALVLKEERQGSGTSSLAQTPARPSETAARPSYQGVRPPLPTVLPAIHLYLLYGRLQLDGG